MRRSLPAVAALLLAGCSAPSETEGLGTPSGLSSAYLAVDAKALYWVDPAIGAVIRQARGSEEATTLATTPDTWNVVAVNDTAVFYYASDISANGSIMSVPKQGGVAGEAARAIAPYMIAVDDDHLYATRAQTYPLPWETFDHPLGGGDEKTLETDATLSLAIAGSDLVGTSCTPTGVWALPRTGGARRPLVSDALCPITIAADTANVCYGDFEMGLYCVPRAGGTARPLTPDYHGPIHAFVLDGPYVYALTGYLMRYAVESDDSLAIASAPGAVGIAVAEASPTGRRRTRAGYYASTAFLCRPNRLPLQARDPPQRVLMSAVG